VQDQAEAAGAEGEPQGELPAPLGAPGEQQVGDVDAGDQQDDGRGRGGQLEHAPPVAHHRVEKGGQPHARVGVGLRVLGGQVRGDPVQLAPGLFQGDPGGEPADRAVGLVVAERQVVVARGERQPQGVVPPREIEAGRHDADHGVGRAVQTQGAAEDPLVPPEDLRPQAVAEEHHRLAPVLVGKPPPERRLDAQRAEELRLDPGRRHLPRLGRPAVRSSQDQRVSGEQADSGQRVAPPAPVGGVQVGDRDAVPDRRQPGVRGVAEPAELGVETDQPAGRGVGERREQDAVDQGPGGGHGADTDSEGQRGGEGERRRPRREPRGVAELVEHSHLVARLSILTRAARVESLCGLGMVAWTSSSWSTWVESARSRSRRISRSIAAFETE